MRVYLFTTLILLAAIIKIHAKQRHFLLINTISPHTFQKIQLPTRLQNWQ